MSTIKIFTKLSNLLFVAAILLGLFLPQVAPVAFVLILPALMITLTVTLLRFPPGFFNKPRTLLTGALWGNLMSYLVLGNLIILGSIFLIRDEKLWIGLVLIAAVPPAVVILPLSEKLQGDKMLTLTGFAGTYLGALILIPLIGAAFLKFIPIHYDKLIILAVTLIGLPLILSRIAVDRNWDTWIERYEGNISDGCFFVLFYALAAHNRHLIKTVAFGNHLNFYPCICRCLFDHSRFTTHRQGLQNFPFNHFIASAIRHHEKLRTCRGDCSVCFQ